MSVQLKPLPAERFDDWRAAARQRVVDGNRESGLRIGADATAYADEFFATVLANGEETNSSQTMLVVDAQQRELGTIWLVLTGRKLFVLDLDIEERLTSDQNDALLARLVTIAADMQADKIAVPLFPQDAVEHALAEGRGFGIASIQMVLEPLPERNVAAHVDVSPMTEQRFPQFVEASETGFAQDLVTSGRYSPEDAIVESRRQLRLGLPEGLATEGHYLFTASVDDVEVGVLWIGLRTRDERPHMFVFDIEVAADQRRRGFGRELMHAVEREARRLGAKSVGLHVFGFNVGAIRLYEQLGYRRVEETRVLDV
ncbi:MULTISPECIES: N-acetyltransferase [unclassified Microbacterium]|uniref:GNAT family N-acetyltransferase n=1 Tax=unclassified Microbacterium TaxID=2609290 RepID=UPI00160369EB|nr:MULTISPECIES: GNAT family N-acetyltransferase [unclassified Microbacterium]MBT2484653.1 GNAT family N-acetyltransferase [Microbacterium sp. ISL-108]